jgi:hypothetical protein
MKTLLRVAAVSAVVLTLGGCAAFSDDDPMAGATGFTAAAPAAASSTQLAAVVPARPAPAIVATPARVTYIVRTVPVLQRTFECPLAQAARARVAEYRPALAFAPLSARALEHRRVYRLTNY